MVQAEHAGIFVDDLSAFAGKWYRCLELLSEFALSGYALRTGIRTGESAATWARIRVAGNQAEQRETPVLPVSFIGEIEKGLVTHDGSAERILRTDSDEEAVAR